jgi:Ca2+-transporting ATPase
MNERELSEKIMTVNVFARVSPEHKIKLVKALKSKGFVVAMTGDGVNDAPALQEADIGVAMGITGTDVARGASSMVLVDDNFSTIVNAVEEGRNIYNNIKKAIVFLLSCNLGEVITVFLSIVLKMASPLLAIHILWINLITDSLPALSLGFDPEDGNVMKVKPRKSSEGIFYGRKKFLFINGIIIGMVSLAAFIIGTGWSGVFDPNDYLDLATGRTMTFLVLSMAELLVGYTIHAGDELIIRAGAFSNKYLNMSIVIGILVQVLTVMVPGLRTILRTASLGFEQWIIVIILSLIPVSVNEIYKAINKLVHHK